MAYAAVVSLKETIQRLQNSSSHITSPQIIKSAYDEVVSLQDVLKRLDISNNRSSTTVNPLDEQIKETICELEHVLESYVYNQFFPQSESNPSSFALDVQKVNVDVDSFIQSVKKLKEDYINGLCNQFPDEEDDDVSPRIDFGGKMVGVDKEFGRFKYLLLNGWKFVGLVGMPGIGKTNLARKIYEDESIAEYFDVRVWVTVGPKYQLEEILQVILAQMNPYIDKITAGDAKLLLVLDDVWDEKLRHDLERLFPHRCINAILLTTRLKEAAYFDGGNHVKCIHYMEFLNNEESWNLLRQKVFGEDQFCPAQLEKAGRKIAENCEGLPLTIVIVADLLSEKEKTLENWDMVAEKQNSFFKDAYDQMSKVLLPSYKYLPQHLKACFLYMGVFPQNYVISCSKLVMFWIAEGFLEPGPSKTLEDIAMEYLEELDGKSLIMVPRRSHNYEIKTCSLHSVFWHLCNREARKSKFSHVMNTYADCSTEVIKIHRRLCVHNNILFGIKDVYNTMASISVARSLLCTGPHHQYPVPICLGLRFLKILDALTVRFYEFPMEVLKIVRLKYLAITCNENLPNSISELWNLQCLIVNRHLSIKSSESPTYLPVEIWDMKELKHIHIMGNNLLDPRGAHLPNLLTLLSVGTDSCNKRVLRGIPNLKKLGIRIELALDDVEPLRCFNHISRLEKLESLKCVVVNPNFKSEVVSLPRLSILSPSLKKLTLSGLGYPWKCIREIESLPMLEVLKLRNYAFRGPKWETRDEGFPSLKVLLIEDSDLVQWTAGRWSFPNIAFLTLEHCYKLEEMPREFGDLITSIKVVDCSPLTEKGAKHIRYDQLSKENGDVDVYVHSSWMGR